MCYSAMVEQDIKSLERAFGAVTDGESMRTYEQLKISQKEHVPPLSARIYPGYFAPIVIYGFQNRQPLVQLMRYSIDPPDFAQGNTRYTTYNARRDNLSSAFWSGSFHRNHGIAVLKGFYEWVAVKDLVRAGVVSIDQVRHEFERQRDERRNRLKALGKPFKPTKAELTSPMFRKIVIEFRPEQSSELLVPIIYSTIERPGDFKRRGFAIVTDSPPPEVMGAGHDRCPVFLDKEAAELWCTGSRTLATGDLDSLLSKRPTLTFAHSLEQAQGPNLQPEAELFAQQL
jgi:putative SOS response-associated peptidase YedK